MLSLRTHVIICVSLFASLIGIAIIGNVLQASGMAAPTGATRIIAMVLFFGLFLAFGLSCVPVMVKLVLGFQRQIGNENVPVIKHVLKRETTIVWVMWGVMLAGLAVALPAMIADNFFAAGETPTTTTSSAMPQPLEPSQGVLRAKPGMTFAEMVQGSTFKVNIDLRAPITSAVAGGGAFDFEIPGTGMRFKNCRYYFASPYTHLPAHIEAVSVGISPQKLSRAQLDAASKDLRTALAADGWLTGHEEYKTEEDQTLHGGTTRGPEGDIWLKNDIVLHIETRRMDDAVAGENAATAGEWIQSISLWGKADYPGIERYAFAQASQ